MSTTTLGWIRYMDVVVDYEYESEAQTRDAPGWDDITLLDITPDSDGSPLEWLGDEAEISESACEIIVSAFDMVGHFWPSLAKSWLRHHHDELIEAIGYQER